MTNNNQRTLSMICIIADISIVIASYLLAYLIRFRLLADVGVFALGQNEKFYSLSVYAKYLIAIVPGYFFIYNKSGLYQLSRNTRIALWKITEANIFGLLFFALILTVLKEVNLSRWFLGCFFLLNVALGYSFRRLFDAILRKLHAKGINLKHIVIVGYSAAARGYIDRINANPQWGYDIHGIIDDELEDGFEYNGIRLIGNISDLQDHLARHQYDEIIISLSINDYYKLRRVVGICERSGSHTKMIPDYNHIVPTVPAMEDFDGLPIINIRKVPLAFFGNRIIKRISDLIGGIVVLVIFAVPMLVIAIAIKVTTGGKIIYKQERVGLHNKRFYMYKFCSMKEAKGGEDRNEWSNAENVRVTKIGRFLRHTSLDELPQIFNVLKGDMSLIGPRPERPFFVEKFKEEIPRYMIKHQVRPGITGWAQVHGLRGNTSISKRIEYDLYYIENWTMILDIKILMMTIFTGFVNKNAY